MQVVSASRHAVERYNEVFPGSPPAAVLAAVQLALPMPKALAHALAGRPAAAARPEQDIAEHRLDPTGTGIFVVLPLRP